VVPSGITFPKTLTVTFNNCLSANGFFTRNGTITIVLSDSLYKVGTTATMTYGSNYTLAVTGGHTFLLQGTVTWTNLTDMHAIPAATSRTWTRDASGKTTNQTTGHYWTHTGHRTVTNNFTVSVSNPVVNYTVAAGSTHSITNELGITRIATVQTTLVNYYNVCRWFHDGKVDFAGPLHTAVLDFGYNPTAQTYCDSDATVSIDGGTAIAFTLP
jgi:hypothetical protein